MLPKLLSNSRGSLDFVKCYCAAKLSNTEIEIKSLAESEDDGRHQRLQVARVNSLQLHLFSNENTPIFLTDPNAIALYLSSTDFAAKNNLSLSCQVSQWLSVAASELRPFQGSLSNSGGGEDDKGGKGAKFEHVSKVLQGLNHYLRLKTFLVGERMSLADVAMAIEISSIQSNGYIQFTDEGKCDLPYLQRWFKTVANQPALREIVNLENGPGDNWKSRKEEKEHKEGLPLEQAGRPSNEKDVLQKKTKKKDKSNQRQKPKSNATTTSDADQRKLRILCLHGYRQNEASFREKTGAFRKIVSKFADLTFISAPLKVPSSAGGEEKDEQTGGKKEEGDKNCNFELGWWFSESSAGGAAASFDAHQTSDCDKGFDQTLSVIRTSLKDQGPFDGVFAFSQGAALLVILCLMQQRKQLHLSPNDQGNQGFKFAILVAPFMSRSSQHAKWFSLGQGENGEKHERTAAAVCSKVEIPTLHVMGETDKVIEKEMSEHILDFFQDPEILVHPGGHFVPATGAQKKVYVDFLARMKDICLKEDKK